MVQHFIFHITYVIYVWLVVYCFNGLILKYSFLTIADVLTSKRNWEEKLELVTKGLWCRSCSPSATVTKTFLMKFCYLHFTLYTSSAYFSTTLNDLEIHRHVLNDSAQSFGVFNPAPPKKKTILEFSTRLLRVFGPRPNIAICFVTAVLFMAVSSVVFLFVVLLGSHGVLCHCGQWRSRHAGRLHKINILTGQTRHQLLTRCALSKEELVGHSGQHGTDQRPDPVNLQVGKRGTQKVTRKYCVFYIFVDFISDKSDRQKKLLKWIK